MNDNEILTVLRSIDNCNFAAIAVSPWHAHGIDAAIMRLQDDGFSLRGCIFAIKHPNSERCINAANFVTKSVNIRIIECSFDSKSMILKVFNNLKAKIFLTLSNKETYGQPFFIIRPSYPDFNWINLVAKYNSFLRTVFISIDEGTSSYLVNDMNSNWVNYIASLDENKPAMVQLIKRSILKVLVKPRGKLRHRMSEILRANNSFYIWNLLERNEENRLNTNSIMAKYYLRVLESLPLNCIGQEEINPYENAVVINSSPPENGLIDPNTDLDTFKLLFQCLKKYKVKAVFKLHPREYDVLRYSDLDCYVSKIPNVSQEVIVSKLKLKPICIIGIDSTTLITVRSIFGIPAISLAKIFLRDIKDLTSRRLIQDYIDTFSDLLIIPEDLAELDHCLSNVLE